MRYTKAYSQSRWLVTIGGTAVAMPVEADDRTGALLCNGWSHVRINPDGSRALAVDQTGRVAVFSFCGPVEIDYIHDPPLKIQ